MRKAVLLAFMALAACEPDYGDWDVGKAYSCNMSTENEDAILFVSISEVGYFLKIFPKDAQFHSPESLFMRNRRETYDSYLLGDESGSAKTLEGSKWREVKRVITAGDALRISAPLDTVLPVAGADKAYEAVEACEDTLYLN